MTPTSIPLQESKSNTDPLIRKCEFCGNQFRSNAYRLANGYGKYCSTACARKGFAQKRRVKTPTAICHSCGKEFKRKLSQLSRTSRPKFCCRSCFFSWKKGPGKSIPKLKLKPPPIRTWGTMGRRKWVNCKGCGRRMWTNLHSTARKYCKLSCYRKSKKATPPKFHCQNCNIDFIPKHYSYTRPRKFCSPKCSREFYKSHRHPSWRGNRRQDRGVGWKTTAEEIRKADGHKCAVCGKPQSKEKLSVDHIVPFRICKENLPLNLISTCRYPCHIRKSHAERKLLAGDAASFLQQVYSLGWPMARVEEALRHYKLV